MSKKRKKVDDAAATNKDEDEHPLLLPATCVMSALNFLPYSDVRSALLAGRAIAVDAVEYINTLNIMEPEGLHVPSARRPFPNVKNVNILCLVKDNCRQNMELSAGVSAQVVPFLVAFAVLKRATVGGYTMRRRGYTMHCMHDNLHVTTCYRAKDCVAPNDHVAIYREMVNFFCGAFDSHALPWDLHIDAVIGEGGQLGCDPELEDVDSPCRLCRSICKNFPMHIVLKLGDPIDLCISGATRMEIMRSRPGAVNFLQSSVAQNFVLEQMKYFVEEDCLMDNGDKEKGFVARMVKLGAQPKNLGVYYYPDHHLKTLESFGVIAGKIPKDDFLRKLQKTLGQSMHPILIWDKQTFNRLVAAGFPLDANDHIIVDTENEPALDGQFRL